MTMQEEVAETLASADDYCEEREHYIALAKPMCQLFNDTIVSILHYIDIVIIKDGEQFAHGEIQRLLKRYENEEGNE